jgi:hypothetical protein
MNMKGFGMTAILLIAATFLVTSPVKPASPPAAEEVTRNTPPSHADDRSETVGKIKDALEELDAQIARLERELRRTWAEMEPLARDAADAAMLRLRERRTELAEWYGGLKHSSAEAWEHVKKGFQDSYRAMASAFEKAKEEFER